MMVWDIIEIIYRAVDLCAGGDGLIFVKLYDVFVGIPSGIECDGFAGLRKIFDSAPIGKDHAAAVRLGSPAMKRITGPGKHALGEIPALAGGRGGVHHAAIDSLRPLVKVHGVSPAFPGQGRHRQQAQAQGQNAEQT